MIIPKHFMLLHHLDNQRGYITLLSVLIVSTVGFAVAVTLILLGLGSGRSSFSIEQSNQAKSVANACAERALQEIRNNTAYSGNGNLTLGQGSCSFIVSNTGGENRLINSSGQVGEVIRKVEININTINPQINILSWQEVADF